MSGGGDRILGLLLGETALMRWPRLSVKGMKVDPGSVCPLLPRAHEWFPVELSALTGAPPMFVLEG